MSLPDYERPPVLEVLLGVHFEAIERLGGPYIGLLWQEFRAQFGKLQEHPPLAFRIESFGLPAPPEPLSLQILDSVSPRIWFLNESETELLQVQQDWFSHNWRKVTGETEYPRYSRLRASFSDELTKLVAFIEREKLGTLKPIQCEVTYVNRIPTNEGETLGDLLTVFATRFNDEFLEQPEGADLHLRFLIPGEGGDDPIGRLHVEARPVVSIKTGTSYIQLTLTARGRSEGEGLDAIFSFFDKGHEWIVRGFTSITTTRMHELWGRKL